MIAPMICTFILSRAYFVKCFMCAATILATTAVQLILDAQQLIAAQITQTYTYTPSCHVLFLIQHIQPALDAQWRQRSAAPTTMVVVTLYCRPLCKRARMKCYNCA